MPLTVGSISGQNISVGSGQIVQCRYQMQQTSELPCWLKLTLSVVCALFKNACSWSLSGQLKLFHTIWRATTFYNSYPMVDGGMSALAASAVFAIVSILSCILAGMPCINKAAGLLLLPTIDKHR